MTCQAEEPPLKLNFIGMLDSSKEVHGGIALAVNSSGDIYRLAGNPLRLTIWSRDSVFTGEYQVSDQPNPNPTDLAYDWFDGLIVDPDQTAIYHFGRRGEPRSPISIIADPPLEPVSICNADNRIILLNRRDGDLWRLDLNGRAEPMLVSSRLGYWPEGNRIKWDSDRGRVLFLSSGSLRYVTIGGAVTRSFVIPIEKPVGVAPTLAAIWIVGDGLAAIDPVSGLALLNYPPDSLKVWNVMPAVDIAIVEDRVFILAASGRVALCTTSAVKPRRW